MSLKNLTEQDIKDRYKNGMQLGHLFMIAMKYNRWDREKVREILFGAPR